MSLLQRSSGCTFFVRRGSTKPMARLSRTTSPTFQRSSCHFPQAAAPHREFPARTRRQPNVAPERIPTQHRPSTRCSVVTSPAWLAHNFKPFPHGLAGLDGRTWDRTRLGHSARRRDLVVASHDRPRNPPTSWVGRRDRPPVVPRRPISTRHDTGRPTVCPLIRLRRDSSPRSGHGVLNEFTSIVKGHYALTGLPPQRE